ncbi:MAG: ATP-binding protein, partial [Sphaerochaeta sp.]|nr:ATP-binding protein [Sphaerochaeta sp.]
LEEKGGILFVQVRDDGVGMKKVDLEALRSRLLDSPVTGEHIGLYTVAARLKLLDARCSLEVSSEEGCGTTISIEMPLVLKKEEEEDDQDTDS